MSYRVVFQSANQLISGAALLPPLVLQRRVMARRRRAGGAGESGSLEAWMLGSLAFSLYNYFACRPLVGRSVLRSLFSGARQRPFVARLSRVLFTVFCFLFSGARQRPFVARLSGVLFSVAVEGLTLWACTHCSPFSRARKRPSPAGAWGSAPHPIANQLIYQVANPLCVPCAPLSAL